MGALPQHQAAAPDGLIRLLRIGATAAALIAVPLLSLMCGSEFLSLGELFSADGEIILRLRLWRIAAAAVTGGALAVAGTACQAVLRNVLAEPYILGVSGGASLGAALVIIAGGTALGGLSISGGAFIGALAALAVLLLPLRKNATPGNGIILSGVIIGTVCSSLLMMLISVMGNAGLHSITWWLLGNLQVNNPAMLIPAAAAVAAGTLLLWLFSRETNALAFGAEAAHHFGVSLKMLTRMVLIAAALLTATAVSLAGIIGFVGLIVPHFARYLVGADHRKLYPAALVIGSVFLTGCDAIARSIYSAQEIPVGVVTALIGGPLFLYLLHRGGGNHA